MGTAGTGKRRKRTYTYDEFAKVLADVAKNHQVKKVIFVTDSTDGKINKKNDTDVYLLSNGFMGAGDFGMFAFDATNILGFWPDYIYLSPNTSKKELKSLKGVLAYESDRIPRLSEYDLFSQCPHTYDE